MCVIVTFVVVVVVMVVISGRSLCWALGGGLFDCAAYRAFLAHNRATSVKSTVFAGAMWENRLFALLTGSSNRLWQSKVSGAAALVGGCPAMSRKTHRSSKK